MVSAGHGRSVRGEAVRHNEPVRIDVILDARAAPEELAELGVLAEEYGLGGVWVSSLLDGRDPYANLSLLAQRTSRIRLGPIAVNPYDTHPVRTAASLLTLNELADGRAQVVVGGGGEVLQALDIAPRRRVRAVRECVQILRGAARGDVVHHDGELYQVRGLRFGWLTQQPPPIYVGASQDQMLAMAAGCADGIMMSDMPAASAARALATLDAAHPPPGFATTAFAALHLSGDAGHRVREARRWLLLRGLFRPWLLATFLDQEDVELVMSRRSAFVQAYQDGSGVVDGVPDRVLDALVDNLTISGSPEDPAPVLAKLRDLRRVGLGAIALRLYADPASTITFLGEVIQPALHAQPASRP